MIKVFCDGGSRGNPGPSAYGFVVKKDDKTIKESSGYIGIATNNVAEYTAIIEALSWLKSRFSEENAHFYLDSQLAAYQLSSIYKIKNAGIKKLVEKIHALEANLGRITYQHVPRNLNKEADKMVNYALDNHLKRV